LPFVLGTEFAGIISKDSPIPEGSSFKPGQRVFGAATGSFAEKIAVNVESVKPLPDNISFDQGAGMHSFLTFLSMYDAHRGAVV